MQIVICWKNISIFANSSLVLFECTFLLSWIQSCDFFLRIKRWQYMLGNQIWSSETSSFFLLQDGHCTTIYCFVIDSLYLFILFPFYIKRAYNVSWDMHDLFDNHWPFRDHPIYNIVFSLKIVTGKMYFCINPCRTLSILTGIQRMLIWNNTVQTTRTYSP